MLNKERGQRIKRLLRRKGWQQSQLSDVCHVAVQTVNKWVAGHTLTDHVVINLCRHLECSADYLLLGVVTEDIADIERLMAKMPLFNRELMKAYLRAAYGDK